MMRSGRWMDQSTYDIRGPILGPALRELHRLQFAAMFQIEGCVRRLYVGCGSVAIAGAIPKASVKVFSPH